MQIIQFFNIKNYMSQEASRFQRRLGGTSPIRVTRGDTFSKNNSVHMSSSNLDRKAG